MMVTATVFVGISVDGFLARRNHDLDFLPENAEPHGYEEFIATVDTIVIGRNTFDKILTFDGWPYSKDKRVVVLSSRPVEHPNVEHMSGAPAEIMEKLAATGAQHVYVDGGITIQEFLRAEMIQRLVVTRVPVLIGDGIPLFGSLPHDIKLEHVATRAYPSGLVQTEYRIGS